MYGKVNYVTDWKKIIAAVSGVKVTVLDGEVSVEARRGNLNLSFPEG